MPMREPAAGGFAAVLGHRGFRLLWLGQSVSFVGDQIFPVAVALRVLDTGGSASDLSLVLGARAAALAVVLIIGGMLADRLPQIHVMIVADAVRLLAVAALALSPAGTQIWLLGMLTFVTGAGEAMFLPAYRSVYPVLLPGSLLQSGNALTSVSMRTGAIAGPALAGLLTKVAGVGAAFGFDSASYAVSVGTLLVIALRRPALATRARSRPPALRAVADGFRVLHTLPWIGVLTAMSGLQMALAIPPWLVLLPVIARRELGGTYAYVLLLALFSAGAVIGALTASRYHPRFPGFVSLGLLAVFGAVELALAGLTMLAFIAVLVFVAGAGIEVYGIYVDTAMQQTVPPELLGRVMAVDALGSVGLAPVGFAFTGWAIAALGDTTVLTVAGLVMLTSSLLPLTVPGVSRLDTPQHMQLT